MQDYECTASPDGWPAWLGGTGDEWLGCCMAHDHAFDAGTVTLWTHVELGHCVLEAGGWIMAPIMALATIGWWLLRHSYRTSR